MENFVYPIHSDADKHPRCPVCAFGFHKIVKEEAEKGRNYAQIKDKIRKTFPERYKASQIRRNQIQNHILSKHDLTLDVGKVFVMKKARKDYVRGRKSIEEIGEDMMTYVSRALDMVQNIPQEQIDNMSAKDKFAVANQASRVIQKGQEIALKARSEQLSENKFLHDIGVLASSSPVDYLEGKEKETIEAND